MKTFVIVASVAVMFLLALCILYTMGTPQTSGKDRYATLSDLEKQQIVDEVGHG